MRSIKAAASKPLTKAKLLGNGSASAMRLPARAAGILAMLASDTALSPTYWIWMWNSGTFGWEPQRRAIKELSWLLSALAVSANGKGFAQGQRKVEMERRVIPQRGRGAGFNTNRQPVSWLTQSTHGVKSVGSGLSQNADNAKLLMSWLGEVVMSDYMQVDQKVFCRRVTFSGNRQTTFALHMGKVTPGQNWGPKWVWPKSWAQKTEPRMARSTQTCATLGFC